MKKRQYKLFLKEDKSSEWSCPKCHSKNVDKRFEHVSEETNGIYAAASRLVN